MAMSFVGRLPQCVALCTALLQSAAVAARDRPQCSIELQAAENIVYYRDHGRPKEFLTDLLPPRPGTPGAAPRHRHPSLTGQMYMIIDEVYANPAIGVRAYLEYRNLECLDRADRIPTPPSLSEVALFVERCQTRHDKPRSGKLGDCVARVLNDYRARRAPTTIAD
ncbi:MAG: hypothetical protein K2Y51_11020 [Gammaproteobacteria bacterium]|nr:hypothetical protein [Gammaproteobacteria bacterium]